jgi:biotin transporter BioY
MTTRATTLGMRSAAVAMACAATLGASAVPAFAADGGQTVLDHPARRQRGP